MDSATGNFGFEAWFSVVMKHKGHASCALLNHRHCDGPDIMQTAQQNRILTRRQILVTGLCAGSICYLAAECLAPHRNTTPTYHDVALAARLGFIYTPLVGIWLGWRQRSFRRGALGAGIGILIAIAYMFMCTTKQFLLIMVGFPTLLGGGLAILVGSNSSPWQEKLVSRGLKGLLAGFVFGVIYAVVLNVLGFFLLGFQCESTSQYIIMMWRAGPVALGLASASFLLLIGRAVGLDE
jgi:hypothetical protein